MKPILLLLLLFSCATLKNTNLHYAYHVGQDLIYNRKDSVTVIKLEVSPDGKPMYLVIRIPGDWWKMHVEEDFLTPRNIDR